LTAKSLKKPVKYVGKIWAERFAAYISEQWILRQFLPKSRASPTPHSPQDWADPILQKPYDIKDGLLYIPDVLGVGLEWDEDAVAANQVQL